jgi:hypothetical protein
MENYFDYLGKNTKLFSFIDIKDMKYGILAIGVVNTIGIVFYFYFSRPKPNPKHIILSSPTETEIEEIDKTDIVMESINTENLKQLKLLSDKKKELNDLCSKITNLQGDIEIIREKLETQS